MTTFETLESVLDSLEYYVGKDGKPFTPKEHFIETYHGLVSSPHEMLKTMSDGWDDLYEDRFTYFIKKGGGESGAIALIFQEICLLDEYTLAIPDEVRDLMKSIV